MNYLDFHTILEKYIPIDSIDYIIDYINKYDIQLNITKPRNTKLGDYRPPIRSSNHRISINKDLNKYAFLITLVHEIAHLLIWNKYSNKVKPHGLEWRKEFQNLLNTMIKKDFFPNDIKTAIIHSFFTNKRFSSTSSLIINDVLRKYSNHNHLLQVKDIPNDSIFILKSGKTFIKMHKLRTRFKCKELNTNKIYTIHPLAEIIKYTSI